MRSRRKQRWYLYSGVRVAEDGSEEPFVITGPPVRERIKVPAGGRVERSADGRWLTVFSPDKDYRDGFRPIRVYIDLD